MVGIETSHNLEKVAGILHTELPHGEPVSFACRYYNVNTSSKQLTDFEATALEASKVSIVAVWENGYPTKVDYFTKDRGFFDGKKACEIALSLHQPDSTPIYFAIDFDAYRQSEKLAILAYLQGVEDGFQQFFEEQSIAGEDPPIYSIGVYGGINVLEWTMEQGLTQYFWQAFAPGWSGGRNKQVFEGQLHTIDFNQKVAGIEVEIVRALDVEDFGGWTRVV